MIYSFKSLLLMLTRPGPRALLKDGTWALAVPEACPLSIPEKLSACRAIMAGRAVAVSWPEAGDVEHGIIRYVRVKSHAPISEGLRRGLVTKEQAVALWDIADHIHNPSSWSAEEAA